MTNQILEYDKENEMVRLALIDYLNKYGVMQTFVAKKTGLSDCSISLFLAKKRILVRDKLDLIKSLINYG